MLKKTLLVVCSILLLIFGEKSVYAEETLEIDVDQYYAEDGKITVFVNQNKDSFQPLIEKSFLIIGKQKVNIETIDIFGTMEKGVSYLYMIDISGSMDQARIEIIKKNLKQMVEDKGNHDNICIITMGNDMVSSGFLTDKEELITFIDTIEVTREDTNLYQSIKEALNLLKTDKAVNEKRCLIIFSDGADDQVTGITKEEAEKIVNESHIPVFTVAMLKENPSGQQVENAKVFGSFARYSAGGSHFAPAIDGHDYTEICSQIKNKIKNSFVITADISEINVGDGEVYIEIEMSDGIIKAEDGMTVPTGEIVGTIKEVKEKEEAEEKEQVTADHGELALVENTVVEEKSTDMAKIIAIAVMAAILLIVSIVAVGLMVKKEKRKNENILDEEESNLKYGHISVKNQQDNEERTIAPTEYEMFIENRDKKVRSKMKVVLFRIGPGIEEKHEIIIKNEIKIGRNKKCQICLAKDTALSGIHCTILYRNGDILIRDEKSTNGTFVNGVPIIGEFKLNKDDIILFGSSEYRICWE